MTSIIDNSSVKLFSNDSLLYNPLSGPHDEIAVKKYLEALITWSGKSRMRLNKIMRTRPTANHTPAQPYNIHTSAMPNVYKVNYVG